MTRNTGTSSGISADRCRLTLAATGSEASAGCCHHKRSGMYKRCADGDVLRPKFAIMNPELACTLPPYQTASGAFDIFSHCMERYFSHTPEVELQTGCSNPVC